VQRQSGFRISIFDERSRGDSSKPRLERVVVAAGGAATLERNERLVERVLEHQVQVPLV